MNQIESLEFFNSKANVKTVAEIDYNDLDKLITEVFRGLVNPDLYYYESVAYEEWGNYEKHSFDIDVSDYCEKDWERVEEKLKGGEWPHYGTRTLLCKLVKLRYIPPCELLVDVFW